MQEILTKENSLVLRGVLDGIGDGIILTDQQERILYSNEAAMKILGCREIHFARTRFMEICPLYNFSMGCPLSSPLQRCMQECIPIGLEKDTGIIVDGQGRKYLSATCSPIRTQDGNIRGCSVILRDITHMRRLEIKIEEDQHYLRAIFSAATVGLCILDQTGAILELNDAAEQIMEVSREAAFGQQFGDAFHCENSMQAGCGHGRWCSICPVRHSIEAALRNNRFSSKFTVAMRRLSSNKEIWLNVFVSEAWTDNEKHIILSLIDISARKRREQELEQARAEAEAASAAKGQFLANMSHEIRTPINGMVGMIDLTLRSELTEEQRENLLSAKQCSEYLLRIINDILDFSKLEGKAMELEELRYDFPKLLRDVLSVHEKVACAKKLSMKGDFAVDLPHYVRGDPLRMRQILHNLINNALKFTLEGGISLKVYCAERADRPSLEFMVQDTGIGMQPEDLKKLFRAFSQVDGSTTRRFGGTGLGLMIVKDLIEVMGGEITVSSVPGKGSTFYFWIPCIEETGADEEIRDKTVFVNPAADQIVSQATEPEDDILDLLQYCNEKLKE